ncbi:MAG: hypothetical protein JSW50_01195 [Candidatus Latescibacterota bacterium]|nr:MAG: hypothetical protein JSW50_01195 [Candidatus Latescibacterota bacterium]
MRHILFLCAVLIAVVSVMALANPIAWPPSGDIVPCEDLLGYDGFFDGVPGLMAVHIVLPYYSAPGSGGVSACQFSAPQPACLNAQYLSDTHVFPVTIGNSQTGVAIGFGSCEQQPIHVLTINFFYQGPANECCFLWVRPSPDVASGEIELVDCNNTLYYGKGGAAIIDPDENDCIQYVATELSTWGKVKSLYAD